ncbi:Zinc finger CCCH domain-containing protein 39 [Striga hermonthica]|uniref:Zinc finger CCCH domain-containing protein 39 n=1 Tax=Striga hermonthica TaxID=68872 RepID=A0A9N7RU20_STRHE|nr:Zinc finger CCCH domain-containing protein 39 [Striga hermonthica]
MSYPDPSQPALPLIPPPFSGDPSAAFWPPLWAAADHHPPDQQPQFKRPRTTISDNNNNNRPLNLSGPTKGTSHIFYKTRMCAKFIDGTCKNGDHCTFAHGPDDLREPPPNWQEIIREKDRSSGQSGNSWIGCSENEQRLIHRMKICKKYYNGEECPYGERCNFLHERGPPPPLPLPLPPPAPARRFRQADAVAASEQRESFAISIGGDFDQRAFWKTRVCSKWEMGHCPYGDKCHYAHGHSELRFSGNNVDEAEQVVINASNNNNISIPRNNVSSVSGFSTPTVNLASTVVPINGDAENKKASKWKLTKKINRIYADWLDDADPPHFSANEDY